MVKTRDEKFTEMECTPCKGEQQPMSREDAEFSLKEIKYWQMNEEATTIFREFTMKDFVSAVDLIRTIAKIAEGQGHHPDIHLTGYRNLRVEFSTHAIGGLSENDFIMAARISELPMELKT